MIRNSFIFLSGVGEKTERALWRRGIRSWNEYHETGTQHLPERIRRRRKLHERHLGLAQEALDQGRAERFARWLPNNETWRLWDEIAQDALYLDIETTGLAYPEGRTTVVGGHIPGRGTELLVKGQDLSARTVQDMLDEASLVVTFNGSQFDLPFLKREFDVRTDHLPHLDLRFALKKVDITGGLKRIEVDLGIARGDDLQGVDGYEAVKLWKRWERRGDHEALDTLLTYNRADVENMVPLAEIAYGKLKRATFEAQVAPER